MWVKYFIGLDKMSLDELEIWRLLCRYSNYETCIAGYTVKQLVSNSDDRLKLTTQKVRTILKKFEKEGYIKLLTSGSKGKESTLKLTIKQQLFNNNQTNKVEELQEVEEVTNNNLTTIQQQSNNTTKKKEKENNKYIYSSNSNEVKLANYLYKLIQKNNPKAKEPNLQVWAKHIDLMIRVDNRTVQDIKTVIDYCQNDSFWHSNILSTKKLRDKFDMLYLKAIEKEKAPTGIGAKKNNYNFSICNDDRKYTMGVKML